MHIILYILDALRADHLGCYGYSRQISPNIDQLAAEGSLFENCFTSSTWTRPVAASILTGTYPLVHAVRTRNDQFVEKLYRLPEMFSDIGYKTAAFNTMGNLASKLGFSSGFDQYHDLFYEEQILQRRENLLESEILRNNSSKEIGLPLAEDVNEYLFCWLKKNLQENTFSFIWSIDPHEPYDPPIEYRKFSSKTPSKSDEGQTSDIRSAGKEDRERIINLYDDEIRYSDYCIGELIRFLKANDIYDETLILLCGDHGDAFFEHGFYSHGHMPYDEIIHVPFIMKLPKSKYKGIRVKQLVELIDIFPTLAAFVDCDIKQSKNSLVQGYNLIPLLSGNNEKLRDFVYSDSQTLPIHNRYLSIRDERWKYMRILGPTKDIQTITKTVLYMFSNDLWLKLIKSPRHFIKNFVKEKNEFLFDIRSDPGEKKDVLGKNPEKADKYRASLNQWMTQNAELAEWIGTKRLDAVESELLKVHLEKLGYL